VRSGSKNMTLCLGAAFSTLMVTEDGDMSVFGVNMCGDLGLGHRFAVENPTLLDKHAFGGDDVVMASAAPFHSACVTSTGTLFMWGVGATGTIPFTRENIPTQVFPQYPVLMVACGWDFTMLLTRARQIWTSGSSLYGQLGHLDREYTSEFVQVDPELFGNGATVTMIAVGCWYSMALTHTAGADTLWTWGKNLHGELGHGDDKLDRIVPVAIPADTFDGVPVVSMHGGLQHTLVVTADGSLWGCGDDSSGALGLHAHYTPADGDANVYTMQKVVGQDFADGHGVLTAANGNAVSIVLAKNNTVWVCGRGTHILGTGTAPDFTRSLTLIDPVVFGNKKITVVAAGSSRCGVVTEDGDVWLWNDSVGLMFAPVLHARIGRWHNPPQDHALAFAMMSVPRLNASASGASRDFPADFLQWMFNNMHFQPHPGTPHGLLNMMGRRAVPRVDALDLDAPVVLDDEDAE